MRTAMATGAVFRWVLPKRLVEEPTERQPLKHERACEDCGAKLTDGRRRRCEECARKR